MSGMYEVPSGCRLLSFSFFNYYLRITGCLVQTMIELKGEWKGLRRKEFWVENEKNSGDAMLLLSINICIFSACYFILFQLLCRFWLAFASSHLWRV